MYTSRRCARRSRMMDCRNEEREQWYWRHHPCQLPCLEDLSIYIIFVLTYSSIRAIYIASLTLARHLGTAACLPVSISTTNASLRLQCDHRSQSTQHSHGT